MIHRPRQTECTRCIRSKINCDKMKFSDMEPVAIYPGVSVIVLCKNFVERVR